MKAFFRFLFKYPISIICYGLYSYLCYGLFNANVKFVHWLEANPGLHGISYAEGVSWMTIFMVVITLLFALVLAINAALRKNGKFYLWLVAIVIVQGAATTYLVLQ